jgi:NMD protein affecting ribosome stability and mRNA decay
MVCPSCGVRDVKRLELVCDLCASVVVTRIERMDEALYRAWCLEQGMSPDDYDAWVRKEAA